MSAAIFAFLEDRAPARRLADALGRKLELVHVHTFPDGESLPTVSAPPATAILYRSLDRPNDKIVPLLLSADALRRAGAGRVVLVAPYLPYLRQDEVFAPGQPLSRDVVGGVLGRAFDRIVTVQPHLHRTVDLSLAFGGRPVTVLEIPELFARAIGPGGAPLIVGPDAESGPWAAAVAHELGASHLVLEKRRLGDEAVELSLPEGADASGRRTVIVDDISSTGGTIEAAAHALQGAGAASIEVVVAHALFGAATQLRLARAGVGRILSTDSCEHPTNAIRLAGVLAGALEEELSA